MKADERRLHVVEAIAALCRRYDNHSVAASRAAVDGTLAELRDLLPDDAAALDAIAKTAEAALDDGDAGAARAIIGTALERLGADEPEDEEE